MAEPEHDLKAYAAMLLHLCMLGAGFCNLLLTQHARKSLISLLRLRFSNSSKRKRQSHPNQTYQIPLLQELA